MALSKRGAADNPGVSTEHETCSGLPMADIALNPRGSAMVTRDPEDGKPRMFGGKDASGEMRRGGGGPGEGACGAGYSRYSAVRLRAEPGGAHAHVDDLGSVPHGGAQYVPGYYWTASVVTTTELYKNVQNGSLGIAALCMKAC